MGQTPPLSLIWLVSMDLRDLFCKKLVLKLIFRELTLIIICLNTTFYYINYDFIYFVIYVLIVSICHIFVLSFNVLYIFFTFERIYSGIIIFRRTFRTSASFKVLFHLVTVSFISAQTSSIAISSQW